MESREKEGDNGGGGEGCQGVFGVIEAVWGEE